MADTISEGDEMIKGFGGMTEPIIAVVDPTTLARLHEVAETIMPGSSQNGTEFAFIVGKILADLSALGLTVMRK